MARKNQLREMHYNTVLNKTSKSQETSLSGIVTKVVRALRKEFPRLRFDIAPQWRLGEIIDDLKLAFPDVSFCDCFAKSSMKPDGGILYVLAKHGKRLPVLISEVKNQGANDLRKREGKGSQAIGNAIERLGKNVIGLRAALLEESIFPFVCFGYGCDFADTSSIIDRVKTIAMFGGLNELHLHNEGPGGVFNRGTFYFREKKWSDKEMFDRCIDIARRSVLYYLSKYGADASKYSEVVL